ncbi:MAG: hypothetical protein ACLTT1_09750 [[Clostridium] scindens]
MVLLEAVQESRWLPGFKEGQMQIRCRCSGSDTGRDEAPAPAGPTPSAGRAVKGRITGD